MALTLKSAFPALGGVKSTGPKRQGWIVPLRATAKGRLALATGDLLARQVIAAALSDGENSNPFRQDRTLGAKMLFSPNDPKVRSSIMTRLTNAFEEFERQRRYRLMDDTVEWSTGGAGGEELILTFRFHDLEADASFDFVYSFSPAGGS